MHLDRLAFRLLYRNVYIYFVGMHFRNLLSTLSIFLPQNKHSLVLDVGVMLAALYTFCGVFSGVFKRGNKDKYNSLTK